MPKREYNFGRPIFTVRIRRTDQPGIDPVCISADSRFEAEQFCRLMFRERLIRIVNSPFKSGNTIAHNREMLAFALAEAR